MIFTAILGLYILKVVLISVLVLVALKWLVGRAVLPAQSHSSEETEGAFFLDTPNGKLYTISITPSSRINLEEKTDESYIIAYSPNGVSMTNLRVHDYVTLARALNANVIGFDYPNVGKSTGHVYSQAALVNAGIAQVQRLLDKGVPATNITLYGHSLGGAVATLTAVHFHKKTPPQCVSVMNDRSFSTIGNTAAGLIRLPFLRFIFNPLCYLLNWNMNAAEAYKSLPKENKMLMATKYDEVIHYKCASLFRSIKPELKKEEQEQYKLTKQKSLFSKPERFCYYNHHCMPITQSECTNRYGTHMTDQMNTFISRNR